MRVLVASDSFKGCLSSCEVGEAIKEGILKAHASADVTVRPVSDGGDGMLDIMMDALNGRIVKKEVKGPLGTKVLASYGIVERECEGEIYRTAVIEMAEAAGITLLDSKNLDPLVTTTYGVGELIMDAISNGIRHIIMGIGGSATNDGGLGMLKAMGFGFYNEFGDSVGEGCEALADIVRISDKNVDPSVRKTKFMVACDVSNPLCGENGASYAYGPQKGAPENMLKDMDSWMDHYAYVASQYNHKADKNAPGSGAAGGVGYACATFLDALLEPGFDIVLRETGLEEYIKEADIVVTGEGKIDGQTINGKTPIGVAKAAKKYGKRVIAYAGSLGADASTVLDHGIDEYYRVTPKGQLLSEAMKREVAVNNISTTVEECFKNIIY